MMNSVADPPINNVWSDTGKVKHSGAKKCGVNVEINEHCIEWPLTGGTKIVYIVSRQYTLIYRASGVQYGKD
jgi:hypothetical protein